MAPEDNDDTLAHVIAPAERQRILEEIEDLQSQMVPGSADYSNPRTQRRISELFAMDLKLIFGTRL